MAWTGPAVRTVPAASRLRTGPAREAPGKAPRRRVK